MTDKSPWYSEGLSFSCTGCGKCCTGSPGYVWVTEAEITAIASHLNLSVEDFSAQYIRKIKGRYSLTEHPSTYDCPFLKDKQCTIYAVRPVQCKTYPWWTHNLETPEDWKKAALSCEGITLNAPKVPLKVIKEELINYELSRS